MNEEIVLNGRYLQAVQQRVTLRESVSCNGPVFDGLFTQVPQMASCQDLWKCADSVRVNHPSGLLTASLLFYQAAQITDRFHHLAHLASE